MSPPIPATLPGLLRPGTGVLDAHGTRGVWVERIGEHGPGVAWETGELVTEDPADLTLDTDDATSRAHLAWWIFAQPGFDDLHPPRIGITHTDLGAAFDAAMSGQPATAEQIATLTTVARRLAGLEP